ncbi:hypothetical protein CVU75_03670 [Candidatus Dependentiae bacterium HGW-Dependentiae-1]|nr:MAG: hypothetical protein CVU75_03670 [Candidatus Dependentiae bacterium HGW-Dependentiae-1]
MEVTLKNGENIVKGIFNTILIAACMLAQAPASAMQPIDEHTCNTCFTLASLVLGTGIAGMVYYKCRQNEQAQHQKEARDYCINCLQEAKRITIQWAYLATKNPHTPQMQKRALARINKLFNPLTLFRGVALEKDKHYLVSYIDTLAEACPADPLYSQKLSWFVRDAQTKEKLPNEKTVTCVLDLYDNLIDIINEESAVKPVKKK